MASFVIVTLILWNTYTFFQIFKNDERVKMEVWAESLKTLLNAEPEDEVELPRQIISNNKTIPIILTENNVVIKTANIDDNIVNNKAKLADFLKSLRKQNDPIIIRIGPNQVQHLYYGNSSLLNKLKYYPVALLLIIFLFGALVYNFYKSTKMATQNKLWAGLQTITDRFSKIGSEPILEQRNIIEETEQSFDYLKSRFSSQVDFSFKAPKKPIMISLNPALHSWTVENLVKNAIDAMRGKGKLTLEIVNDTNFVNLLVTDTGKGIPKHQYKRIFEPGFTTKKRGWGLGLSLTKRIVEEYHKGKIKVLNSEVGKGTTIQVTFKKA
jgi:hypothetical protein